jgi:hypothetical protein
MKSALVRPSGEILMPFDDATKEFILSLDPKRSYRATIKEATRTAEQLATYWMIITEVGNQIGFTKDECDRVYKKRWLSRIFMRDDHEYRLTCDAITGVKKAGMIGEYDRLLNFVIDKTHFGDASIKQGAEYIDLIINDAILGGLNVTVPRDKRHG